MSALYNIFFFIIAIGEPGELEVVSEYKVEMVCEKHYMKDVVEALKFSHPYEEPAYDVVKLEEL